MRRSVRTRDAFSRLQDDLGKWALPARRSRHQLTSACSLVYLHRMKRTRARLKVDRKGKGDRSRIVQSGEPAIIIPSSCPPACGSPPLQKADDYSTDLWVDRQPHGGSNPTLSATSCSRDQASSAAPLGPRAGRGSSVSRTFRA